jgi:glycerol-3-phosphate dehydrogenase subunit B
VTVIHAWSGATSLYSGALDLEEWQAARHTPLDANVMAFATALGIWRTPARGPARIATSSGVVRPCRGHDAALLDLEPLAGKIVGVADLLRDDCPAALLCRSLSGSDWAKRTGTKFLPLPINLPAQPFAARLGSYDFARLQDDRAVAETFAEALRAAPERVDAWLLGPWLGLDPATPHWFQEALRLPVGELASPPGGPAGARFDLARTVLLQRSGAELVQGVVTKLEIAAGKPSLHVTRSGGAAPERYLADAVVLALGGVAAGGIRLQPPQLAGSRTAFVLSLDGPVALALDGKRLDAASSLHGVDVEAAGWQSLERLGVAANGGRVEEAPSVLAAGDVVARRPRTVLEAVRAGCEAAETALAARAAS